MFARLILCLMLSGCASLGGTAWNHTTPEKCDVVHPNGRWSHELCRDGKGVLVWWRWTV